MKVTATVAPDLSKIKCIPQIAGMASNKCINDGVVTPGQIPCSCPTRTLPPSDPPTLPVPAIMENTPLLKEWINNRYRSYAFNSCEHQKLPLMKGSPPLKLHVDHTAPHIAVHVPAQVPLNWQLQVKVGLDCDCRLGVLEGVPLSTPTRWQHWMVVVAKHDGSQSKTLDYNNKKKTPRQTHHTPSPWSLASLIPPGVLKTTFDCWHGYHRLPLAEEDRDFTIFITFGGPTDILLSPKVFSLLATPTRTAWTEFLIFLRG